ERRAVGELAHVLGAVDDGELPLRVDEAGIASLEPAVLGERVARSLILLVVADEDACTLHLHLAAIPDPHLRAGHRPSNRVRISLLVGLQRDEAATFSSAIDLLEVDTERAEETEGVGAERRAAGETRPRVAQA